MRAGAYEWGVLRSRRLPVKVVCVGNITVGGTGKTPTVMALAHLLGQAGRRVAIVSRGYKRDDERETLIVGRGKEGPLLDWRRVGDEPYLLSARLGLPVVVGANRYLAGKLALETFRPEVILLDDGYQHLALERDLNLLLINAANPFGNGCLLPAGVLREPLSAISRAQAVLLTKADQARDLEGVLRTIRGYNPSAPIFRALHRPVLLLDAATGEKKKLEWLAGKRVVAFSGIGDPAYFARLLREQGAQVLQEAGFPDHYAFRRRDLLCLQEQALASSAEALITTAKDALRLPPGREWGQRLPLLVLEIELGIFADDSPRWEEFWRAQCP